MIKSNLGRAALEYAANGYKVFPLVPGDKTPATENGFYAATTDLNQIKAWWTRNPNYNIGLLAGEGFVVIDLDVHHDKNADNGIAFLRDYQEQHGAFPETVVCATPTGGQHLYYAVDKQYPTNLKLYPGVDVCAIKHYVVVPPSVTKNGVYQWVTRSITEGITKADDHVITFISKMPEHKKALGNRQSNAIIHEGGRHSFLLREWGIMQAKGLSDDTIRQRISFINQQQCDPPMSEEELEKTIFEAFDRYPKGVPSVCDIKGLPDKWQIRDSLTRLDVFANEKYGGMNDIALSRIFADCLKDVVRYNATAKKWMYYDGIKWSNDADRMSVEWLAKEFYDAITIASMDIENETNKEHIRKKISRLNNRTVRMQMIEDAKSDYSVRESDFNKNPDLFNCQNCVIDLSTGKTIPHSPELMLSKVAAVEYRPENVSQEFERFLKGIMMNDQEAIDYLQTILGYALNGTSEREEAYIFYGSTTRNGKSTLLDTIRHLFGDYGLNVQPETLAMKAKDSRNASGDIARLDGCRLVQMPEPPKNMKLDVALLKQMTGNDVLTARRLYESDFEFKPVFKLFINTNYLPVVVDDTLFESGRIKVIPFNRQFRPEEQDHGLKIRLLSNDNLSGIFNWLLKGNQRGRKDRNAFNPPAIVSAETEAYKLSSDKVQCFINDRLDEDSNYVISAGTLYTEYEQWCRDCGYGVDKKSCFFDVLRKKGLLVDQGTIDGKTKKNVVKGYRIVSMTAMPF